MTLTQTADELMPELGRYQRRLLIGRRRRAAACRLAGWFFNPTQFYQSYLMAYMLCLGVTLGCLALGMVHQLSGGAWGVVIRRPIGAASRVLPVMTLLFLPDRSLGMGHLYIWTHADIVAHDEVLQAKHLYLNVPFFLVRAAIYFAVVERLAYFLNAWSLEQDRTADPRIARQDAAPERRRPGRLRPDDHVRLVRLADVARAALVFDDLRRADYRRPGAVGAWRFSIVVLVWLSSRPPLDRIVVKAHFHDLGNLTLAFVMLWAYFAFSQYLIIWAGNLPQEIAWYHAAACRPAGGSIGVALVVFHFAVPFVLLLSRTVKREAQLIVRRGDRDSARAAAGSVLADRAGVSHRRHSRQLARRRCCRSSLGAIWLGCFVWQLRGRAILPVHDPQFDEALGRIIQRGGERPSTAH